MIINCTKAEFAELLKRCYTDNIDGEHCEECILCSACTCTKNEENPLVELCEVSE